MAQNYDAYRLAPAAQQNPYQMQGSPQDFYAPSASLWGNYQKQASMGADRLPGGFGRAGKVLGKLNSFAGGAGQLSALTMTAGDMLFDKSDGISSFGTARGLGNLATFGSLGAKDKQRDAENARRRAVQDWRLGEQTRMGSLLGQQGRDVQGDLGGELQGALWAGGDLMQDEGAQQNAMTAFQQRYQQYMLGRQRAGQARQVDAMFSDPGRANDRAQRLRAERTQGMEGIAEQYRMGQRNNAFNQARRGTMGGSMDVEQQGDLGRGRDAGAMSLQTGLDAKAQQYQLGDQQQQNALKGLIYADDPNTAAAFSRTLEGINQQGQLVQEQAAGRSQMAAQRGAMAQGYSQAFGGLMSAASKPLGYYLDHSGSGA
jgi:hypothetical protein